MSLTQTRIEHQPLGPPGREVVSTGSLACWLLVVLGAVMRFAWFGRAYDLFVDEIVYMRLGRTVGQFGLPRLPNGQPFFLHPPGFFILEGLYQDIVSYGGDIFHRVYETRTLNLLLGTFTIALLYVLVRRVAGRRPAIIAALFFAIDPFVLRQNGRVLLETGTVAWALLGYIGLSKLVEDSTSKWLPLATGMAFGMASLSKDIAFVIAILPLVFLWVTGWVLPRRRVAVVAAVSLAPYAFFFVIIAVTGRLPDFLDTKTLGVRRLLGLVQVSGFNKPGSPSLSETLIDQFLQFWPTYLIILFGSVAGIVLIRASHPGRRLVGVFVGFGAILLGYSVAFGTIEEHFLYFLFVPAVAAAGIALDDVWNWLAATGRPFLKSSLILFLALLTISDMAAWVQTRATPDNSYEKLLSWMQQNIPRGTAVAYTSGIGEFALEERGYQAVPLRFRPDMERKGIQYYVISTKNVNEGYSFASPESVAKLTATSRSLFSAHGPSAGSLILYQLDIPPR